MDAIKLFTDELVNTYEGTKINMMPQPMLVIGFSRVLIFFDAIDYMRKLAFYSMNPNSDLLHSSGAACLR